MPTKHYKWKVGEPPPELGAHSLAKHRIIESYVRRYLDIVTANYRQPQLNVTFVDGYSGGGRYSFQQTDLPGSPLLLLSTVAGKEIELQAERKKGFRINADYFFVDEIGEHTEFLREEIRQSAFSSELDKSIRVINGDFNEEHQNIVKFIRSKSPNTQRAIFLLDQYGWSTVAFRTVRSILQNLTNAEVFLTFSVDHLIDYISLQKMDLSAFAEIDVDIGFAKELAGYKQAQQTGWRTLIQNGLYQHIQKSTAAPYYSPFFIKPPSSHRAYWFIHLSKHPEARNEIGLIHWQENNTSVHHGGPGLNSLGFTAIGGPDQMDFDYRFDEDAKDQSFAALREQVPRIIRDTGEYNTSISVRDLFETRCNDTPVVRNQLEQVLAELRKDKELNIETSDGKDKPRATKFAWEDRIILPAQKSFFGRVTGILDKDKES